MGLRSLADLALQILMPGTSQSVSLAPSSKITKAPAVKTPAHAKLESLVENFSIDIDISLLAKTLSQRQSLDSSVIYNNSERWAETRYGGAENGAFIRAYSTGELRITIDDVPLDKAADFSLDPRDRINGIRIMHGENEFSRHSFQNKTYVVELPKEAAPGTEFTLRLY